MTVLIRSAAVGFDSLPREMVAILEAVWSGRMPLKWCKGVCSEAVSLKDGMTGTCGIMSYLHHRGAFQNPPTFGEYL